MHPYTLGYLQNPVLIPYFQGYYQQLVAFLRGKLKDEYLVQDFLFIPDISTIIEGLRNSAIPLEIGLPILEHEATLFFGGKKSEMFSEKGAIIPGTKIRLTPHDRNPDNGNDIHPDHIQNGVGVGWGNISEKEWLHLFSQAFDLLRKTSSGFAHELDTMIAKIIPIGVSESKHNSGSYSNCLGHLYMSYPVQIDSPELAVLEAIIHESNHNKLNLIMKTDPLILSDRREIFYSPYRPDARHIYGVYIGLHALVGVISVFFQAHLSGVHTLNSVWLEKALMYHMKNALAAQVLQRYGRFTPLGQTILTEMLLIQKETSERIRACNIAAEIKQRASEGVKRHFLEVQAKYSYLQF